MSSRPERVHTVDYHTGGEPFRIVEEPQPALLGEGLSVLDRREVALHDPQAQWLRALLCSEPRGHADMYGGFVVPPDDAGAHLGVLFWHKDGFSTACGHGTIALGTWAVESGRVPAPADGESEVVIDVPSGRVAAVVRTAGGRVVSARFRNVASYAVARAVTVDLPDRSVSVDIGYGGAMYAVLPASAVGLRVASADYTALIARGRQIRDTLNAAGAAEHRSDPRLSGIYGTIFTHDLTPDQGSSEPHVREAVAATEAAGGRVLWQRNVTVFADGEVDRSPCGSGTSARVALLAAAGELGDGDLLVHSSIVGSTFTARVAGHTEAEGAVAVIPEVTGTAYRVGESTFTVDPADPLVPGFVLR